MACRTPVDRVGAYAVDDVLRNARRAARGTRGGAAPRIPGDFPIHPACGVYWPIETDDKFSSNSGDDLNPTTFLFTALVWLTL